MKNAARTPRLTSISRRNTYAHPVFAQRPFLGPLLFDNTDSDARDHCAAERSMPSRLRTSSSHVANMTSLPLLAPPSNLHGHRLRRDPHLLPSQTHRVPPRKAHRSPLRPSLLATSDRMSGQWTDELHQNRLALLAAASDRADRRRNADRVYCGGERDSGGLCAVSEHEC